MDVLPDRHSFQTIKLHESNTQQCLRSSDFPLRKQKLGVPWNRHRCRSLPEWCCLGVAPSPSRLTGKPSRTYWVGPFIVELFAVGVLVRSPKESPSGTPCRQGRSSRRQHGCRNSHVRESPSAPVTGFGSSLPHPLCLRTACLDDERVITAGMSASPSIQNGSMRNNRVGLIG